VESYLSSGTLFLLIFVAAAAIVDLRTRRIPNLLTVSAAAVGLALNLSRIGGPGAVTSGAGILTGFAAFLPFYLAGGFGAGDVKAMAAVGAFLGPKGVLLAATCTLLVGGLGALAVLAGLRWKSARREGSWQLREAGRYRFPYGLAIACGTVLSLGWS
jgi:prepilin peptidase CpaA